MNWIRKFLHPHPILSLLLGILSCGGLIWVFTTGRELSWFAYPIYGLSAYALTVLCIWLVPLALKKARQKEAAPSPEEQAKDFRRSLSTGLVMNLVYGLFQLGFGWLCGSAWTMSQGAYQLVMALINLALLSQERKIRTLSDPGAREMEGWRGFAICGWLLLFLHLTMTGQVFQMIWRGETEFAHEILILGVAAYTFYKLVMALIRVLQHRKNASPLWGAARNIDLSEAIMNLYTLQTGLLAVFATADQRDFQFLMNSLTGAAVCLMTVGGAIGMIAHGRKKKNQPAGGM